LRKLRVQGLLSFGPDAPETEFGPLNVLIGPNASGKSNLIEVLALLRDTPEFDTTQRWASEWLWRGATKHTATLIAEVDTGIGPEGRLHYELGLEEDEHALAIGAERLKRVSGRMIFPRADTRRLAFSMFDPRAFRGPSQLFRHSGDERFPEIARLGAALGAWHFYRQWELGPQSPLRAVQRTGLLRGHLQEDARNLGWVLDGLLSKSATKAALLDRLREAYPAAKGVRVRDDKDLGVTFYIKEGALSIPATRLSDGTLHWLCLLAVLLDPTPPPLVCIEEPEVGLHPDLLHVLVDLLRSASERTQIFVTTHSEVLVDALSDTPEAVIVCERSEVGTTLRRLDRDKLSIWLDKYSLGELWTKGELGGTRW
jgi:predicted ATPase